MSEFMTGDAAAESTRCPRCRAYGGSHAIDCPVMPPEYARSELTGYHKAWLESQQNANDLRTRLSYQVTFWQGKFMAVKHENNQLRKKIYQLKIKL